MRVAIHLHIGTDKDNEKVLELILTTYNHLSNKYYTHATPTLFNAGTPKGNYSSCFLLGSDDSREGIMKTLDDCTQISKWSGGIGFHMSMWRASGSLIRGTNGDSSGIVPFLKLFNDGARAFNQGGKRMGSFAAYLEPHHPDIMNFLQLRRNSGDENMRTRDLFLALWISDLFMERVEADAQWSTFCPDECPGLNKCWGDEYKQLYLKYENEGLSRRSFSARDVWKAVFESQKESGMPYLLYKDAANRNSMQKNIGTIASSNLCVSGDTKILTDKGHLEIKQLTESIPPIHNVWNGEEYTPAIFAKTGQDKELLHLTLVDGTTIKCTPEHRFIIPWGWRDTDEKLFLARDLIVGMELIRYSETSCSTRLVEISDISVSDFREDTYCFNEPKLHRGIFNGILTANCSEIMLYSDTKEYAVCNLASICLPQFVEDAHTPTELEQEPIRTLNHEFPVHPVFNYKKLIEIVCELVVNLNNVIDKNWNPVIESARSNFFHRPIGIGIQGLADVFLKFRVAFDSDKAKELNKKIFETIYYSAVSKSSEICRLYYKSVVAQIRATSKPYIHKIFTKEVRSQYPDLKRDESKIVFNTVEEVVKTIGTYPTYLDNGGSPMANGKFHWELFGLTKENLSGMYDWETLRNHVATYGVRNSLLVALMPTASTSQIMGSSSCFEPYVSNIYKRKTLAGEFIIVNKYLIHDLQKYGLWSDTMKQYLIANNGSIQNIEGIPSNMKEMYKTVWEIKQKSIIDMAVDRQAFVDQSQSMNLYLEEFTFGKFNSMQLYAWKRGLKTGCYYQRTRSAIMAQKFTIDTDIQSRMSLVPEEDVVNIYEPEDLCLMCGS
jgi:ribonucleotide reductase alpha subunit